MIRKQSHDGSLATVRAICFRIIMAVLFYALYFAMQFHLHIRQSFLFELNLMHLQYTPAYLPFLQCQEANC